MDVILHGASPLQGSLTVPPDKAICHRAVLIAALAEGETELRPWPSAEDCQRTLQLIQSLGAVVRRSSTSVWIQGCGVDGIRPPGCELWCGESGTTMRLGAGFLAGQPFTATLTGGPSLSRRPMRRVAEPLTQMGAHVEGATSASRSGAQELYPPLVVRGRRPLRAIRYTMPVSSAQVKSTVLLAALAADGRTIIQEPQQTRDHTERMLRHFGGHVEGNGREVSIEPGRLVSPGMLELPGDFSSAAFFLVAAACIPGSRLTLNQVGINPTRIALLRVLQQMGARVEWTVERDSWEPSGTMTVEARPLTGVTLQSTDAPSLIDELPVLLVAAACAQGTTRLSGMGELRVKETDRIRSMVNGLRQLGVRMDLPAPDVVEIHGGHLTGGVVESAGDHRTAMSLAIAGVANSRGVTRLRGAECVAKSFPEFFDQLRSLAGSSTVKTVDKTGSLC